MSVLSVSYSDSRVMRNKVPVPSRREKSPSVERCCQDRIARNAYRLDRPDDPCRATGDPGIPGPGQFLSEKSGQIKS